MSIFLCFSNVTLFHTLLCEPFCKDIVHLLWGECDGEGVIALILRHSSDAEVLWEIEVWEWGGVNAEELGNLTNSVRAVIEEEEGVVIYTLQRK